MTADTLGPIASSRISSSNTVAAEMRDRTPPPAEVAMSKLPNGELESRVMAALWESGDWLTPAEVQRSVRHDAPLAYTTVMTVLARLWRKGVVAREQRGRAYAYRPFDTKDETAAKHMAELLRTTSDHGSALNHFVGSLESGDRKQLRKLLGLDPQQ
jgi:predicted transcriptional regulator